MVATTFSLLWLLLGLDPDPTLGFPSILGLITGLFSLSLEPLLLLLLDTIGGDWDKVEIISQGLEFFRVAWSG